MTPPEWLLRHDGTLQPASDGHTWFLFFEAEPHYKLTPAPADGRFTCRIAQTENGRRLDKGTIYPSADDALRGGLEELRAILGW